MPTAQIHPDVLLDSRLAIFHERSRWLAVADLHYGYEGVIQDAGGLFPQWGNQTIEDRLEELIRDYQPKTVLIVGDIMHGRGSLREATQFCQRIRQLDTEIRLIEGNHDRSAVKQKLGFEDAVRIDGFFFHHGHLDLAPNPGEIEITGHFHPAISIRDGAGLKLKYPALIQESTASYQRWILPAFSPWASGTAWKKRDSIETEAWMCTPKRVFVCSS